MSNDAELGGPIFGAIFITIVPNVAESISKSAPGAVYGACLLVAVFFMPGGVWGGLLKLTDRILWRQADRVKAA